MKYILICMAVLLFTGVLSGAIIAIVDRLRKNDHHIICAKNIVSFILLWLVLTAACVVFYLEDYYHAEASAFAFLESGDAVTVTSISKGYFFDGPGERSATVFYPGAKVQTESYAPLLYELAKRGEDCFLVSMPFRIAVLDGNAAVELTEEYSYDHWNLAGHSLGGTVAASCMVSHPDLFDRLILLAAYPTKKIPEDVFLVSVYGSNDAVLNKKVYETAKEYWPENATEVVIEGGNHAQYGEYGGQKGDGEATVSAVEQRDQTVDSILTMK